MMSPISIGLLLQLMIGMTIALIYRPLSWRRSKPHPKPSPIAQPIDTVVSAYVLAEHQEYTGYALLQALTICDLHYDHVSQIFHKYGGNKQPWFSLAVAKEPGVFDFDQLGSVTYPGVVLFMDLSDLGRQAETALQDFFLTLSQIQEEVGGVIVNARREPIADSVKKQWLQYAEHVARQHGGTRDLFAD
jgi:FtsZ-interacting cell division protein ZipA